MNHLIGGHAKVFWCRIVSTNQASDGLRQQWLAPTSILHEVQKEDVVEVASDLRLVMEVEIVVEFGELEHHFDCLGFVVS